jgi:hypothetical protein
MKQAQVCIFPSFAETLGMVTIESMALQKARCQYQYRLGTRINYRWRKWFSGSSTKSFYYANMIITLLKDTNLCLTMGKMQDKAIFDIEKIAQSKHCFYQSIIGES